ncbi:hypothetical protein BDC45DRAFT_538446 [Circinella umbellata]|nr:hypothetical protein BDC45DRAFT_538446 [Circinella umbellata]
MFCCCHRQLITTRRWKASYSQKCVFGFSTTQNFSESAPNVLEQYARQGLFVQGKGCTIHWKNQIRGATLEKKPLNNETRNHFCLVTMAAVRATLRDASRRSEETRSYNAVVYPVKLQN